MEVRSGRFLESYAVFLGNICRHALAVGEYYEQGAGDFFRGRRRSDCFSWADSLFCTFGAGIGQEESFAEVKLGKLRFEPRGRSLRLEDVYMFIS
jgi:hypothetical protein